MSMDISQFETVTHVRKPFQVEVVEVTTNNIEALSEFIGELKHKGGTPFIQSEKKLVGNTFKVWPGFFVTVLNGKVRCYSRRIFFEQFVELATVQEQVDFMNGKRRPKQRTEPEIREAVQKGEVVRVPVSEEEYIYKDAAEAPAVEVVLPEETGVTCEHGTPEGAECVYKKCTGVETDDPDDDPVDEEVDTTQKLGPFGRPIVDEVQDGEPLVEVPQPDLEEGFGVPEPVTPILDKRFDEPAVGMTLSEAREARESAPQTD